MDLAARNATLRSWCVDQLAPWKVRQVDRAAAIQTFTHLNATRESAAVFRLQDGQVTVLDKPATSPDGRAMDLARFSVRIRLYQDFFQQVVRMKSPIGEGLIAMSMDDFAFEIDEAPTFAFQKRAGSRAVLINDVDAIAARYYIDEPADQQPFIEKRDAAVFAGSTSGINHTRQSVAGLESERLRSAVYFQDVPDVEFHLNSIVQCEEPEAEQLLRALGFGQGHTSWDEQKRYKFLLSLDGNGATCSRVAIALKSNCVLMKYASPHHLHYFGSMQPWLHYVPISGREQVRPLIELERREPGFFEPVSKAGRDFAETFLDTDANLSYAAKLMEMYFDSFAPEARVAGWSARRQSAGDAVGGPYVLAGWAHCENEGDRLSDMDDSFGVPTSGRAVEGFIICPPAELGPADLEYAAIGRDTQGPWCKAGDFSGSKGQNTPLYGLRVRLRGDAARVWSCRLSATFVGVAAEQTVQGPGCALVWTQPLESFRVALEQAGTAA